ncbi:MAG: peptide chain release factor N(5)-glutamine methyltransferase [Candidatus Saccharimonas sp.]
MIKKSRLTPVRIWLRDAAEQLASAGIASALLDAEIILAHTLRKSRIWLHAHGDETLALRHQEIADARLRLRLDRIPVAYIVGHKWFYGRLFSVTPATLIPRPESEAIIELLTQYLPPTATSLIDVGCGSGCLGITAALEHPTLSVTLADISRHALVVAAKNATDLGAKNTTILKSDLLTHAPLPTYDAILANLPYVSKQWPTSPELAHEPPIALYATNEGLTIIFAFLPQAAQRLLRNGLCIVEADPCQHAAIIKQAALHQLQHIATKDYAVMFTKI